MKVTVVGCGKIGTAIINRLVSEGHDIIAVDKSKAVVQTVTNIYDVMCVTGSGTDQETLIDAGAGECDMFISVTDSDETNMLSCFMAKKMGAKHTVSRIRSPEINDKSLSFIKQHMDISLVINPELLAAKEIFNILKLPSAVNIETFSRRNFEMIELVIKPGSKLDGVTLVELRKKYSGKFLICAVGRGDEVYIPGGDFKLMAGDKIGLTAETSEIEKLLKQLDIMQKRARNIIILGAGRVSEYLSRMLVGGGNNVKAIDLDAKKCEKLAKSVPEVTVINGDGSEQEVLLEEGIGNVDAFITLTGMDEQNILISYFASTLSVPKVVTKVNRQELYNIAERLGLDTLISPKHIIEDVVSRYARALQNSINSSNIETLYRLLDEKVEAVEFKVGKDFEYINVPIKEIKTAKNAIIAGIIRNRRQIIIPSGDDYILEGDKVVIISTNKNILNLNDIIE
ncbi:MAG: Trk system potassium transporter TrkA [Clostridia bacterium]|nr:Trk system potassium transporter TrkA [Clostridia bacterium]MBR3144493.1 Trk system potassium transporter TrkA [Clostridia bacterium]